MAEGQLDHRRFACELGRGHARCAARSYFSAHRPACRSILWRRAARVRNLYSSSIVALDANTGKLRWSFQLTHHDLWDYDAEAAPSLMEVVRGGKKIPVVVAVSKPGLMFFLDRETGKSIYPVEERPVPQTDVPGEETWPTQPFPLKPPPHWHGRVSSRMRSLPANPNTKNSAATWLKRSAVSIMRALYTPYSSKEFRIIFPGQQGGPNYGGVSVDPRLAYVFVNVRNVGGMGRMDKSKEAAIRLRIAVSSPLRDPGRSTPASGTRPNSCHVNSRLGLS